MMPIQSPIELQTQLQRCVPASDYTYEELTDIYNQTRVDYIVPMPMNAKRMREYVNNYDVDLPSSVVAMYDDTITGVGMLGLRDNRAWITRLGIIPTGRRLRNGSFLMDALIDQARRNDADVIQLEVIDGNEPAYNMFVKYGFQETRKLAIIRRPPSPPQFENPLPAANIITLTDDEIMHCLANRPSGMSWVEETPSMVKTEKLFGYRLEAQNGESGWIVFYSSAFQMGNFVVDATSDSYNDIVLSLLHNLHRRHGIKDTKIENVPLDHPLLELFKQAGYIESFRRIEMIKHL